MKARGMCAHTVLEGRRELYECNNLLAGHSHGLSCLRVNARGLWRAGEKMVRMAYLGVIASHTVNGVAAIHSQIIRDELFRDFAELWPEKFTNVTNGVTQRRWLAFCNEPLRHLITQRLGSDAWIKCAPCCFATFAALRQSDPPRS